MQLGFSAPILGSFNFKHLMIDNRHITSSYSICVRVVVSQLCPTVTPWTVAHQAPLSMEFSRQEYCSGLPFPPPGDLLHPGIQLTSPALADGFFIAGPLGKPR